MDKKRKMICAEFYPDGRVVYIYEGDAKQETQVSIRGMTPKDALHKRLEEYKIKKASEKIMEEYDEAFQALAKK